MKKKLPRYTEASRYPYHWLCTKIEPLNDQMKATVARSKKAPQWMREQTHLCYCSAWKQKEDGTFLHWREYRWQEPIRGSIKSKPIPKIEDMSVHEPIKHPYLHG